MRTMFFQLEIEEHFVIFYVEISGNQKHGDILIWNLIWGL